MPGCLISKDLLIRIGLFDEGYIWFEDLILFFKITRQISIQKIGFMPDLTYIWRDYSGVTTKDIDSDVVTRQVMQNRLGLIRDHLMAYKFFSNSIDSEVINHCKKKVDVLTFKFDYLESRLSSSPFKRSIYTIIKHRKNLLNKINISRIYRYINGRVEA